MNADKARWAVVLVWACFLARGAFYAAAFPVWEGFDEWSHFAVIQRIALRGEVLVWRHSPVSRQIDESLKLAPVPWELRSLPPPSVTEDAYWRLPESERKARQDQFQRMPPAWASQDGSTTAYEALQGPLYYWIAAPLLRAVSGLDVGSQVLLLRWFSVAIASLAIPLCYLCGRIVCASEWLGAGCAAVAAAMPEFLIDVSRVGNDCLGVVLFSLLTWVLLKNGRVAIGGIVLGLGLLTKAYFLTAIPAVAVLRRWLVLGIALAIGAWWYVRNVVQRGTLSGLSEAEALHGKVSTLGLLGRVREIPWASAVDGILFSHLWFGGWSSLTVRSWTYHVFYVVIAVAAVGVLLRVREPAVRVAVAVYAAFWAGQLYNVVLLYAAKGVAVSMGWYMYAVVAAEVALAVVGLGVVMPKRYVPLMGVGLFALLDLYGMHAVALPYYTGLVAHRANGSVAALHVSDVSSDIFGRLAEFKGIVGPGGMTALWVGYVAATLGLLAAGVWCGRGRAGSPPQAGGPPYNN